MGVAVTTPMLRFQFVKGQVTSGTPDAGFVACCDGTAFPMEVRVDQLAEIMYQVKFATFTSSTFRPNISGVGAGVAIGDQSPRVQYDGTIGDNYRMSGYWCLDSLDIEVESGVFNDFIPSDYALGFLGDSYSSDVYADSTTAWFGYPEQLSFRDISDDERGLWMPHVDGKFSNWNNQGEPESIGYSFSLQTTFTSLLSGYDLDRFKTAFTWYSRSHSGILDDQPGLNIPWISDESFFPDVVYEQLEVCVQFNGQVAVVGDMDDLYNSANKFFIGMHASGSMASDSIAFSTNENFFGGSLTATSAKYRMSLNSGAIDIPIYTDSDDLTGMMEHSAIEWWPYAKRGTDDPFWNHLTGARIP